MKHTGGKTKIQKALRAQLMRLRTDAHTRYVEPFMGMGGMMMVMAPEFPTAIGVERLEDIILMFQAARDGWQPPTSMDEVPEDRYRELKFEEPSALRGFVGTQLSFAGKWWGGYARCGKRDDRDFAAVASDSLARRTAAMANVDLVHGDYRCLTGALTPADLVYCDPPYAPRPGRAGTGYPGVPPFDHDAFWRWAMEQHDAGVTIAVSEYAAPAGWTAMWSKTRQVSTSLQDKTQVATERLFVPDVVAQRLNDEAADTDD